VFKSPVWHGLGALTTKKTHGVSVFYIGDPDVMHVPIDMYHTVGLAA
jgi:hypothetical protein